MVYVVYGLYAVLCSVHRDESHDTHQFTMMVMQWGQFLDHDLTSTPTTRGFRQSVPKVGCSSVLHCTAVCPVL